MKAEELIRLWNNTFGLGEWPKTVSVDSETYANCCQYVFDRIVNYPLGDDIYELSLGPHNGLMLKEIELLLRSEV